MKKQIVVASVMAILMLGLSQCKSTSKTVATAPLGDAELAAARVKWPDATLANLESGKLIHEGVCTKCHGIKAIGKHSESEWIKDIERMAPKAKITDAQKQDLTMYVLSVRSLQP